MRRIALTRWLLAAFGLVLSGVAAPTAAAQSSAAVAPNGGTLATRTATHDIALWDVKTGTLKARLTGHQWPVYDLAFAPDGATLVSGNQYGEAILWDARTGRLKQWLRRDYKQYAQWTPVAFSSDGKQVAVGERDLVPGPPDQKPWTGRLYVWDAHTGLPIKTITIGAYSSIEAIWFWPDGRHVTLGVQLGTQVWDWRQGRLDWAGPHDGSLVAASADGKLVMTSGPMSQPTAAPGSPTKPTPGTGGVGGFDSGVGGGFGGLGNVPTFLTPDIWDMAAHRRVSHLVGEPYPVDRAEFSPDRRTVLTRGYQSRSLGGDTGYTVSEWKAWDVPTGRLLWASGKDEDIGPVCFSPNGQSLLSRGRLLDARNGKLLRTLEAPSADASVLFSLDGKLVAASSADPPAFWDAGTGKRRIAVSPGVVINPVDGAEMVLIPAGPFTHDSPTDFFPLRGPLPHDKPLPAYDVYRDPVSVAQFRRFCAATGHPMPPVAPWVTDEAHSPMIYTTWEDAQAYCRWAGASLPTESQWAKAAWGQEDPGKSRASPYGVQGLRGDTWQWCEVDPDNARGQAMLRDPRDKGTHPLRGGSWPDGFPRDFGATNEVWGISDPKGRFPSYGFRCVCPPAKTQTGNQ